MPLVFLLARSMYVTDVAKEAREGGMLWMVNA